MIKAMKEFSVKDINEIMEHNYEFNTGKTSQGVTWIKDYDEFLKIISMDYSECGNNSVMNIS